MKKFAISVMFAAGFAGYVLYQHMGGDDGTVVALATKNQVPAQVQQTTSAGSAPSGSGPGVTTPAPSSSPAPASSAAPAPASQAPAGMYKDGTYTGSVGDAYYGYVQVQATVSGGALSDVTFLQYPNTSGHTLALAEYAMPILKSEAIQAQNANVDTVSGATETSKAFRQSLAAALALAKN